MSGPHADLVKPTGDPVLDAVLDYGEHTWRAAYAAGRGRLVEANLAHRTALLALGRLIEMRRGS